MKKTITFAIAFISALAFVQFANAQGPVNRPTPPGGCFMTALNEDGRIDLAKLPPQMPQERKDAIKAFDKDGDGFLSPEEFNAMPRPRYQFWSGQKPDFINDDGAFNVEKAIEAIKAADKNGDGTIDAEEMRAAASQRPYPPRYVAWSLGAGPGQCPFWQGQGQGLGRGYGQGMGPGQGYGRGYGQGMGPGQGYGRGYGQGPGLGQGYGRQGNWQGQGQVPGRGQGMGQGQRPRDGRGRGL
ncbi:MAG: EF-hand domain-containing protein [Thermoguttaceae bacterium]|jgi:hypothetical protein